MSSVRSNGAEQSGLVLMIVVYGMRLQWRSDVKLERMKTMIIGIEELLSGRAGLYKKKGETRGEWI
jgi:hypothetical protein